MLFVTGTAQPLTKDGYCALHAGMASGSLVPILWHSSYQDLTSYLREQRLGRLRKLAGVTDGGI